MPPSVTLLNCLKIFILAAHLITFAVAFQAFDEDAQASLYGGTDPLLPVRLFARKQMQRYGSVEKTPEGIAALPDIDVCRKFILFDAATQDRFDDLDRVVCDFNNMFIDRFRHAHGVCVQHEGHHDPEQFPVVEEKFDIDGREIKDEFGCRFAVLEQDRGFFIELIDVVEENMTVNVFLAAEMQINGALAEFGLFRNVFDRDIFETFFKKQLSGSIQNRASPLLLLSSSSLLKPHDDVFSYAFKYR
jgi:hypothetical protein